MYNCYIISLYLYFNSINIMMPPAYSDDLKWLIVFLYYDNYSILQITNLLYISKGEQFLIQKNLII
ncbi:hypothetical protein C2G38_2129847 [Gigaspora rosea]|uniref:Uncharacterized protein n=1 Tax=Gigaspora rosea TaxID=44941 RepID=A0A397TRN2_9GLOM|nr:hypothetical protein C2G38_2129847 [Gigaspora rosea]